MERLRVQLKERMKKDDRLLSYSLSTCACMWMYLSLSAGCVLPQHTLDGVCMCWQAGVTSGFHEGLSRLGAAKYSTEGISGNLLIREKRLNLRSCNCKWRWGLSEGLSVSLQGKYKQASSGSLTHIHVYVIVTNTHAGMQTQAHINTHINTIWHNSIRLFLLVLINCIIWTANSFCQRNNNMADK